MVVDTNAQQIFADIVSGKSNAEIQRLAGGVEIDYRKLRLWLFQTARKKIEELHPDWIEGKNLQRGSLDRLVEVNVLQDLKRHLAAKVREFCAIIDNLPVQETTSETKKHLFGYKLEPNKTVNAIDERRFKGGFTELHEAVRDGNFERVKHLVEVLQARTDIKDNDGRTPYFYAVGYGHKQIAEYLSSF